MQEYIPSRVLCGVKYILSGTFLGGGGAGQIKKTREQKVENNISSGERNEMQLGVFERTISKNMLVTEKNRKLNVQCIQWQSTEYDMQRNTTNYSHKESIAFATLCAFAHEEFFKNGRPNSFGHTHTLEHMHRNTRDQPTNRTTDLKASFPSFALNSALYDCPPCN